MFHRPLSVRAALDKTVMIQLSLIHILEMGVVIFEYSNSNFTYKIRIVHASIV